MVKNDKIIDIMGERAYLVYGHLLMSFIKTCFHHSMNMSLLMEYQIQPSTGLTAMVTIAKKTADGLPEKSKQ